MQGHQETQTLDTQDFTTVNLEPCQEQPGQSTAAPAVFSLVREDLQCHSAQMPGGNGWRSPWRDRPPAPWGPAPARTPRTPFLISKMLSQLSITDGLPGEAERSRVSANFRAKDGNLQAPSSCAHGEEGCWGAGGQGANSLDLLTQTGRCGRLDHLWAGPRVQGQLYDSHSLAHWPERSWALGWHQARLILPTDSKRC